MQPWNKNNLINFGVIITIAVVIFAFIVCAYYSAKAGGAASIIIPAVAIGYACVVFFKKYYIKDTVYKD